MPTYFYGCKRCSHEWEAEQRITDDPLTACPKCEQESAKRQIAGGTSFALRGSGWYRDGYQTKR